MLGGIALGVYVCVHLSGEVTREPSKRADQSGERPEGAQSVS